MKKRGKKPRKSKTGPGNEKEQEEKEKEQDGRGQDEKEEDAHDDPLRTKKKSVQLFSILSDVQASQEKAPVIPGRRSSTLPDVPREMLGDKTGNIMAINTQLRVLEVQGEGYTEHVSEAIAELEDLSGNMDTEGDSEYLDELRCKVLENAHTLNVVTKKYVAKEKQLALVLGREEAMCTKLRRRIEELQAKIAELEEAAVVNGAKREQLTHTVKKAVNSEELNIRQVRFKLLKEFQDIAAKVTKSTMRDGPKGISALQQWVHKKQESEEDELEKRARAAQGNDDELATAATAERLRRQNDKQRKEIEESKSLVRSKEAVIRSLNDEVERLKSANNGPSWEEMAAVRRKLQGIQRLCGNLKPSATRAFGVMSERIKGYTEQMVGRVGECEEKAARDAAKVQEITTDLAVAMKKVNALSGVITELPAEIRSRIGDICVTTEGGVRGSFELDIADTPISLSLEALNTELAAVGDLAMAHKETTVMVGSLQEEIATLDLTITRLEETVCKQETEISETKQQVSALTTELVTTQEQLGDAAQELHDKQREFADKMKAAEEAPVPEVVRKPSLIPPESLDRVRRMCGDLSYKAEQLPNAKEMTVVCNKLLQIQKEVESTTIAASTVFGELDFVDEVVRLLFERPADCGEVEKKKVKRVADHVGARRQRWLHQLSKLHVERKQALMRLRALIKTERVASVAIGRSTSFLRWLEEKMDCVDAALDEVEVYDSAGGAGGHLERLPSWVKARPGAVKTWVSKEEKVYSDNVFMPRPGSTCGDKVQAANRIVFEKRSVLRRVSEPAAAAAEPCTETRVEQAPSEPLPSIGMQRPPPCPPCLLQTPPIPPIKEGVMKLGTVALTLPDDMSITERYRDKQCSVPKPGSPKVPQLSHSPLQLKTAHLPTIVPVAKVETAECSLEKLEDILTYKSKRRESVLCRVRRPSRDLTPNCINTKTSLNTAPPPTAAPCFSLC